MYFGYLKDSATCKRAFQITGKHVNEVIEKARDSVGGFLAATNLQSSRNIIAEMILVGCLRYCFWKECGVK